MALVANYRTYVAPRSELPTWPFVCAFGAFPVLWLAGLGGFAATFASLPVLLLLVFRRDVRLPAGFLLWLLFLGWTVLSATQLDTSGRIIGYAFRLLSYVSAAVLFVFVWNTRSQNLSARRICGVFTVFLGWVVIGGWLGVLVPKMSITTPMEQILPGALKSNSYVWELVHPKFAEIQYPWGAPEPYVRPSAPFAYTNTWGSHFALLVPFAVCYATMCAGRRRFAALALVVLGLVPAFATLNRGMFLSLCVGVIYVSVRLALRGQVFLMTAVGALLAAALYAAYALGVFALISARTEYSPTNDARSNLYEEAFTRTLSSPLIGAGSPRPSLTLSISVGTQGQFWNIMFSYGFVGLALFCGFVWWLALSSRNAPGPLVWLHAVPVMASFMLFFYGLDGSQLVLIFVAGAVAVSRAHEYAHARAPARPTGITGGLR
ncbi:hypothetical protein LO762_01185 [Actinocorallia sp. API 0066]|uniref:hypothetical protein n=1 Tax=Actinocorallia sp. API 0066 TaxID=2896846 RepID=UPI001E4A66DC|nr:hypothetical protein [Actinocorallia sp. API 0066]MCD0447814.1 hypothetical protein [Actinocorallia sp. API 0066]